MTYIGKVENGVVVLPPEAKLADGTAVKLEPIPAAQGLSGEQARESFYDRYKEFDGIFKDLPADFAENHDHYLHGTPKRTPRE